MLVAFNAVIPLMTVVNYSVQETFGENVFFFEGVKWFEQILRSPRFHESLRRSLLFTAIVLVIEVPLGVAIALTMPRKGPWVSVCLVLMAMPLLIPWNVVGAMWNILALPDIGLLGHTLNAMGIDYNFTRQPVAAWATLIAMDVWHWTSLVVLLAYAGLSAIPDAYYQAAKIDGASRWAVFRYIQLPKMKRVLTIAILLRFMDSFMIYTEAIVVTGGGPGNSTTVLSIDLVKIALGQFDLGPAAAMSLIYFLIILLLSWIFYTVMTKDEAAAMKRYAWLVPALYIVFVLLPIYWLLNMSFKTTNEILGSFTLWPQEFTLDNYRKIFTDPTWYRGYLNSISYVVINTVLSVTVALPAAYAFSRYRFLGDKHLFFWLLTNRMAPPAVFALPFFQLYSAIGLFDTRLAVALAHCLFNIPLAVWILEGFMSSVPKELDETAFVDGYPFWRFFVRIFIPTIAAGIGVAAFFCFMFSWVELLLAKTLTSVDAKPIAATMTRTASTSGYELGLLAAAGALTIIPGAFVIYFVRNYIAKGFALGRV